MVVITEKQVESKGGNWRGVLSRMYGNQNPTAVSTPKGSLPLSRSLASRFLPLCPSIWSFPLPVGTPVSEPYPFPPTYTSALPSLHQLFSLPLCLCV